MDEEIEQLVIGVRADTAAFARDLDAMRAQIEGPFAAGAARAGRGVEAALLQAVRHGKLGFDELRGVALKAMDEIARAALRDGVASVTGGGGTTGLIAGLLGGLLGLPSRGAGRMTRTALPDGGGMGWPAPAWPSIDTATRSAAPARAVHVAISLNGAGGDAPRALERSARQVARAVRAALEEAE
ncbi:tail tape measure protein [Sphingomonas sp. DT-51]|uniref:tail tape measure protein n=1 Tax=Sphingomonas sp. DT-51 TaxID=3396165 RepID=UPI003F1DBBC9